MLGYDPALVTWQLWLTSLLLYTRIFMIAFACVQISQVTMLSSGGLPL